MPKALPKRFTNEEAARAHLEALQWPEGPICPHCGIVARASRIEGGRKGLWFCNACRKQFTVTVGTVFERSKVPLHTWLYCTHLICSSKKGISSQQLARMLGVTVKTAWFMSHRIREAMAPATDVGPLGGPDQIVEADEAEISLSIKSRRRPRSKNLKFMSLVERGGRVRSRVITGVGQPISADIRTVLRSDLNPNSTIHTDGANAYKTWPYRQHESVNHNKEFVRKTEAGDKVHTNTAEGYFTIHRRYRRHLPAD